MRLFVGIPLPDHVKDAVYGEIQRWQARVNGIKFVERENLHITLKFIGEVDDGRAKNIAAALRSVEARQFDVEVRGIGAFPNPARARVIWAGVGKGFEEIVALSREIDEILAKEGVPRESKEFHPHVTMGRVKRFDPEIARIISAGRDRKFGTFRFERFVLFRSTLTRSGPIYDVVERYGAI